MPDGNVAALYCSVDDAKLLLKRAKSFYPVAASYIEEGLRSVVFRKADAGHTWHSSPECSQWPTRDFSSCTDLAEGAELCNECVVKGKLGASPIR